MAKTALRLALAQINPTVGDLRGNAGKCAEFISRAKQAKADLIIFPEQVLPGYPAEDLLLKRQFVRDNVRALESLKGECRGIAAIVGYIRPGKKAALHNAAALLADGKIQAVYDKMFLPNYGVFDEKRYFTAGLRPMTFKLRGVCIGLTICEDIWVEKGPVADNAAAGAKIVINISASPYHMRKVQEREKMLSRRAKAHGVCIAYANMAGGQDEIVFDGQSMVVDARGKVFARAKSFREDLLILDMPAGVRGKSVRPRKEPYLSVEEEVLQALVLGTRDYVRKNGFEKVVLGLSGGVDSALVAAVAVEALGAGNVTALFMPSRYSSVQSLQDAKAVAQNLNIRMETVGIEPIFQTYLKELSPFFDKLPANIAEENLQARIRGNLLMAFSNKFGWMVLTTGNKSETSVGYTTLYGDMAGGFAVIKDLYKEWVYRLSAHVNKKAGRKIIPVSVLSKEPTAELRPNQKDSDSLPPYARLDPVLKAYVEKNMGIAELIAGGFQPALVKRVAQLVDRNEYKRRQAAPGIKITPMAFGKDRRYPITNKYAVFLANK